MIKKVREDIYVLSGHKGLRSSWLKLLYASRKFYAYLDARKAEAIEKLLYNIKHHRHSGRIFFQT